ncbi:MAG: hypothetical protein RIG61_01335 [Deltaproteobacteria bacterium]
MKHLLYMILFAIFITACSTLVVRAQTEGFNVKTPVEKISDRTIRFLNDIVKNTKEDSRQSIPPDLVCGAQCFLIAPSINMDHSGNDFSGTGLLSCRSKDSVKLTPPLFYNVTNIESFEENGGGLIIFVTDSEGVESVLGDQLRFNSDDSGSRKNGPDGTSLKSFIAYTGQPGEGFDEFDLSGATLVYGTADTFNAYQQTLDPIDIMLYSVDIPPALRGFNSSLEEWRNGCKE